MAIIVRQKKGSPFDKFMRFIDWAYEEYIIMSVAIVFGSVLFSERFSGMLKNIGSENKKKVLKGVRNATWDMQVAYYWSQKAFRKKEDGIFWLLCTADKALKAIAGSLIVTGDELERKKVDVFCKYYGDEKGKQIYDKLVDMDKRRDDDSTRRVNKNSPTSDLYLVVDELEKELLSVIAN